MEFEEYIKNTFKGYHVEVNLYPSGGLLSVYGCEECGTNDGFSESKIWKVKKGETLGYAIESILKRINK